MEGVRLIDQALSLSMQEMQKNIKGLDDRELVALAIADDRTALETLVKRHLKLVYSVAKSYIYDSDDAQDVVQETFIKVWKNLKKFQPEKNFSGWLVEITKNTALDFLKKRRPVPFSEFEDESGINRLYNTITDPSPNPYENASAAGLMETFQSALARLSLPHHDIVVMHDQKDLTFREISDSNKESINTVKSRYRRAIATLKKSLTD